MDVYPSPYSIFVPHEAQLMISCMFQVDIGQCQSSGTLYGSYTFFSSLYFFMIRISPVNFRCDTLDIAQGTEARFRHVRFLCVVSVRAAAGFEPASAERTRTLYHLSYAAPCHKKGKIYEEW